MSVVITDMSKLNGSIYFLLNVWLVSYEGVIRMEEWVGLCDHITHYIPSTVPVFSMHCSSLRVRSHAQRLPCSVFPKRKHQLAGGGDDWQDEKGMEAPAVPYKVSNQSLYF